AKGEPFEIKAELTKRPKTKKEAEAFLENCRTANFSIENITIRPAKKTPAAPFTTSTLQQESARRLGYTVSQTMMIAQRLYESGKITYMRTDSVNLSNYAVESCKKVITSTMGKQYLKTRQFTTKTKGAQEAHEAIRPTYMEKQSTEGTVQEQKLYDLIWKRAVASQMAEAELEKTTVVIGMDNDTENKFTLTGEVVKFDGFLHVYKEFYDDEQEQENESRLLPPLKEGQILEHEKITAIERFTQHPARYTEAGLVRKLEELGIGRPSTYAPTISTVQQREYVEKGDREGKEHTYKFLVLTKNGTITDTIQTEKTGSEKAKLFPTDIGIVVNDFLTAYFPNILDYNFTADVEKEFDDVAGGEKQWTTLMRDFYASFHLSVESILATKSEHKVGERILGIEPKTGKSVSVKIGRFGPVIQIGTADDEEKPRFSQFKKGLSLETITLEEALDAFKLPRTLGDFEDKTVIVGIGPFGPYVKHNSKYVSVPKDTDPLVISLEEAVNLINNKREVEKQKLIKNFPEEPELEVRNGKYGPYIAYKGTNYKIPKNLIPKELELSTIMEIIHQQNEKGTTPRRKKYAAKKK
ncbi:DNA topoisomerase 1, partial [termite gut metagenome]